MAKKTLAMILGAALSIGAAGDAAAKVIIEPYMQDVTTSKATVCWVTDGEEDPAEQSLGQYPGVVSEHVEFTRDGHEFHQVTLEGLLPSTSYDYSLERHKGTFETAPSKDEAFTFLVYGDSRSDPLPHKMIINAMKKEKEASFVLHSGDIVTDGRKFGEWKPQFFDITALLSGNIPFYPAIGNHEKNSQNYYDFFALPGNERFYSFDWGSAHFAVLDSNDQTPGSWEEQEKWFIGDMEKSRDARFKIVMFHHPLYSTIGSESRIKERAAKRDKLEHLIKEHDVDLVFHGHDHNYQRHYKDGITYVIAGGGGAPLYSTGPSTGTLMKQAKKYHFVKVDIQGDKLCAQVVDKYRIVIDEFELVSKQPSNN